MAFRENTAEDVSSATPAPGVGSADQSGGVPIGIVIVDHGSRRAQSNELLEEVANQFGRRFASTFSVVEPAHMELAEPSIATAYAACVRRGAKRIVVCPFFLGPGKHWTGDIPRLTAEVARQFPHTSYHVTMPLGIDDLILDLLFKRASFCGDHGFSCESCRGTARSGEPGPAAAALSAVTESHETKPTDANGMQVCSTCPYAKAVREGATFTPATTDQPAAAAVASV